QQLEYPWGAAAPGTGNVYAIYACYYHGSGPATCSGLTNIAPVGTPAAGAGLWGQLDLAGSVFEWDMDWLTGYVTPCNDCAYLPATAGGRVLRGGDFMQISTTYLQPPDRTFASYQRATDFGFRCARTP